MELIITTLNREDQNAHAGDTDGRIKYLEFRNRQLEEENQLLLSMLAEALGDRTIVIRETSLKRKPHFVIGENLGGDVIISCR